MEPTRLGALESEPWSLPTMARRQGRAALATVIAEAAVSASTGPVPTVATGDGLADGGLDEDEITAAELEEFLSYDQDSTEADPVFREALRERLWALIRDGQLGRRHDH